MTRDGVSQPPRRRRIKRRALRLSHTLCPDVIGSLQAWSWLPSRRLSNQLLDTRASWLTAELKPGKLRAP
jgi:hypothetical protein